MKANNSMKIGEKLNREFSKKEIQMANKYIQKSSTPLDFREMKIERTHLCQKVLYLEKK